MSDRLWPIHFKAMPTSKPRTPKQIAQKTQTPTTKTPATTATTITATITAVTITITTTIKKTKGKVKRRILPLKRWHKRFGHLNYANVKQLATYSSQIKLANNKELFCEPCIYSKQYAIPNHKP